MRKSLEIILGYAESVKSELLYDLKFNLSPLKFYRAKFDKDRADEKKLCKIIYKSESNA